MDPVVPSTTVTLGGDFGAFTLSITTVDGGRAWVSDPMRCSAQRAERFAQELVGLLTMLAPSRVVIFSDTRA